MTKKNGPWTIKKTEQKYKDDFIELNVDEVTQPDGEPGAYATVTMKDGICVLPIDDEDNVYLIKQFRYALGKKSIEVITGGMDKDESPLECAKREALEEVGVKAQEWIKLGKFDVDTSIVKCKISLYIARSLKFEKHTEQDSSEDIEPLRMSLEEAVDKVMNNEITHGPSCITILKAYHHIQNL